MNLDPAPAPLAIRVVEVIPFPADAAFISVSHAKWSRFASSDWNS